MHKLFLLTDLFISTLTIGQQTSIKHNFISDSLDRYIANAMAEWQIPAVSLAVIQNEKMIARFEHHKSKFAISAFC